MAEQRIDAPTPRTDAEVLIGVYGDARVPVDFARGLEREIHDLHERIEVDANWHTSYEMHVLVENDRHEQLLSAEKETIALRDRVAELEAALEKFGRRRHYDCEDPWYSCPKSPDGCVNDDAGTDCNCGADKHNAELDAALQPTGGKII